MTQNPIEQLRASASDALEATPSRRQEALALLAGALALAPMDAATQAQLRETAGEGGGRHSPDFDPTRRAARAWLFAQHGQPEQALGMVAGLLRADTPWAWAWAADWIRDVDEETLEKAHVIQTLTAVIRMFPNVTRRRRSEVAWLERMSPALTVLEETFPEHMNTQLFVSALWRKMGHREAALRCARRCVSLGAPGAYDPAITMANACRLAEQWDDALTWLDTCLKAEPESWVIKRDRALVLSYLGRNEEALAAFEALLGLYPGEMDFQLAVAHLRRANGEAFDAFDGLFDDIPVDERVDEIWDRIHVPWVGWLPAPTESVVQSMQAALDRGSALLSMSTTDLEAPSALAAARHAAEVDISILGRPLDRLRPVLPVGISLWTLSLTPGTGDTEAMVLDQIEPAFPEPPQDVADAVRGMAQAAWHLPTWWELAKTYGDKISDLDALLGAMGHIGAPPPGHTVWQWTRRVQLAAALLLAQQTGGEAVLLRLVVGPNDWAVEMALVALTELALDKPDVLPRTSTLIWDMAHRRVLGPCCYQKTLLQCARRLPGFTQEARQALERACAKPEQLEDQDEEPS